MSEHHEEMTKTTPGQVVLATVGGLAAPLIAIFLIVQLVLGIQATHVKDDGGEANALKVTQRIQPVGEVRVVDASAPRVEKSGEEVFNAVCASCHTSGALGAPKLGNKGDWSARISHGLDDLMKSATQGIRAMPARGGAPALSDAELKNAVIYMANSAGAKF